MNFLIYISVLLFINQALCNDKYEFKIMGNSIKKYFSNFESTSKIKVVNPWYSSKLKNYVESLGNFLVSTSELSDKKFTFTISKFLNSDLSN